MKCDAGRGAGLIAILLLSACDVQTGSENEAEARRGWLMSAEGDEARFALIERQFRGFDNAMWETGERYRSLHDALERENYDLALYHWDKIKTAIESGTQRRPARRANAEALFLSHWEEVRADIESRDATRAWSGFNRATTACQSCHQAENVEHMNNQPLFDLRRAP